MSDAVFIPQGDTFVPTEHAGGPWDPMALHGGAAGALMTRAIEAVRADQGMFTSRVTVEFLRAVPMSPLRVFTELIRPGRKVQLVQARVEAGGRDVARATALRIRELDLELPPQPPSQPPPPPQSGVHRRPRGEWIALEAATAVELNGVGLVQGNLHARDGHVGTSSQAVLLERRPT